MKQSTPLYDSILKLLHHAPWRDRRHLYTVAWMVLGLLSSGWISLSKWSPYVVSRAEMAQSVERRFKRWLTNGRIDVLRLYAALLREALKDVAEEPLLVALDTSMLWDTFCVIQLALVYRGRSIPLVWKVMKHPSASVAFKDYRGVLGFAARLFPEREIILLADRGFLHGELLNWIRKTAGWHARIRCKRSVGFYQKTGSGYRKLTLRLLAGEVCYYHHVGVTGAHIPAHLVVGWEKGAKEPWIIVSDQPTNGDTLYEYGRRFNIEEGFLDHKSNGFQWESSQLRETEVLQRLCFIMAVATLVLVCQGGAIVASGKRRCVDPHWFRGYSYARIGWDWIRRACARGDAIIDSLVLHALHDPEPARASKRQPDRSRWMDDLPCRIFLFAMPLRS